MSHPNFRTLLPSKVREYLFSHFLGSLEKAEVNCYSDPKYSLTDALAEFSNTEGFTRGLIVGTYEAALAEYNRCHPKCWDNEKQKAFRK